MEAVWSLLSRLTISITAPVVDPTENLGKQMYYYMYMKFCFASD